MSILGSATNPTWAGWDWPGAQQAFASLYTVPAGNDIVVSEVHAYFNTYQGNGAHGYLVIWDGDDSIGNPVVWISSSFVINNGTLNAGGQQWWSKTGLSFTLQAGHSYWIGAYSDQNLLFSTYDTSPHAFNKAMGTTINPSFFNSPFRNDTGQGPCGSYIVYGLLILSGSLSTGGGGALRATGTSRVAASLAKMGGSGGLSIPQTHVTFRTSAFQVGSSGGGLSISGIQILGNLTSLLGGGGGLNVVGTHNTAPVGVTDLGSNGGGVVAQSIVNVPKVLVWRAGP